MDDELVTMHEFTTERGLSGDKTTLAKIGRRAAKLTRATGQEPKGLIVHGRSGPYRVLRYSPEILEQAWKEIKP